MANSRVISVCCKSSKSNDSVLRSRGGYNKCFTERFSIGLLIYLKVELKFSVFDIFYMLVKVKEVSVVKLQVNSQFSKETYDSHRLNY